MLFRSAHPLQDRVEGRGSGRSRSMKAEELRKMSVADLEKHSIIRAGSTEICRSLSKGKIVNILNSVCFYSLHFSPKSQIYSLDFLRPISLDDSIQATEGNIQRTGNGKRQRGVIKPLIEYRRKKTRV